MRWSVMLPSLAGRWFQKRMLGGTRYTLEHGSQHPARCSRAASGRILMKRFLAVIVALFLFAALAVGGFVLLNDKLRERIGDEVTSKRCTVQGADGSVSLTAEQAQMASVVIAASLERGLPERAAVIALATAYQESSLRNLDHGDRDSLGLFQQRPDPRFEWGTAEQIMDPWYSSLRFYEELVKFPDWETADINDQAQAVQRSGHPEAYRKHVPKAEILAAAGHGSAREAVTCMQPADLSSPISAPVEEVLSHVPGVEVTTTETSVKFTAPDEQTLWAAAQLALLNTYQSGISSINVQGMKYVVGETSWVAEGSSPKLTATIYF